MKPAHVLLAIFICLIWGINFVVAKSTLAYMPPFFLLAIRLAISAIVLLPFLRKPELPLSQIFRISITLTVWHFGTMFIALGIGLESSVAVVIDQMRVPFAVVLGYFIFGESINKRSAFGIMLAIIGTFVITGSPNVSNNYLPMWVMLSSSAAWAFYNVQVKNLKDVHMLSFIGWISLFGAPQLFIISAIFEHGQVASLLVSPVESALSLLYMAVFVTIVGHGSWYYLLQKHPINLVVPYSLLTPIFGMAASVVLLNEELSWHIVLGALFTLAGVATIVVTKKPASLKKLESL